MKHKLCCSVGSRRSLGRGSTEPLGRPLEVFELEERKALLPLTAVIFEPVVWKSRRCGLRGGGQNPALRGLSSFPAGPDGRYQYLTYLLTGCVG